MPGVALLSGPGRRTVCPDCTIFERDGLDAVVAVAMMAERERMHIDERQRDGHNAIRILTRICNTTAEIDRVVAALARS